MKILLRFFNEQVTAITIILIVVATNYLNYSAIDNAMTHNLLFNVYIFIILFTIKFYQSPKYWIACACIVSIKLYQIQNPMKAVVIINIILLDRLM